MLKRVGVTLQHPEKSTPAERPPGQNKPAAHDDDEFMSGEGKKLDNTFLDRWWEDHEQLVLIMPTLFLL